MIYTRVAGRLGNQMFFYAIARKIQTITKKEHQLFFDFSNVLVQGNNSFEKGFEDSLKYFNTIEYKSNCTMDSIVSIKKQGNIKQKISYVVFKVLMKFRRDCFKSVQWKYQCHMNKLGIYMTTPSLCPLGRIDINTSKEDNIFIDGRYENSGWFDDIRDKLLQEFTPKYPKRAENERLYSIIENSESVCISIRRGDYVSNKHNESIFNICSVEYYLKAIDLIKEKINNPVFIIFSDDIEWARENIKLDGSVYYETGMDPLWEKLRLMYSCKHFIISNSTFSWWAQYLSRNKNKCVISPNIWFKPNITWPLIEDDFFKIDVTKH